MPVTAGTIERSFSALNRVKTWIYSLTSNERLLGLCMMSVLHQKISETKDGFIDMVIDQLEQEPRRLQLLFQCQHWKPPDII